MKLFVLFPSTIRGGAEEYALTISKAAMNDGIEVHAAFPRVEGTYVLIKDFEKHGISYHPLANIHEPLVFSKILTKGFVYFIRVWNLLKKVEPDVAVVVLSYPNRCLVPIIALAIKSIPSAIVFQLVPPSWTQCTTFRKRLYKWARGRRQKWVAISQNNRMILGKAFDLPPDDIVRIYNGSKIEISKISENVEIVKRELRSEIGAPLSSRILLTVGRLHEQKGYDILVDLIPAVLHDFPECIFVWAGEGKLRESLAQIIRRQGTEDRVYILGHRLDIARIMIASDLFVFPTRFEGGQSFAITEAMSCGLPIVSTNASGICEVVRDGIDGLLSDVEDIGGLRENIFKALNEPTDMIRMARNARERVKEFTEEIMTTQTIQLLKSLDNQSKTQNSHK